MRTRVMNPSQGLVLSFTPSFIRNNSLNMDIFAFALVRGRCQFLCFRGDFGVHFRRDLPLTDVVV
jgi:hypothetical protein